jgi:pilus assembly protein CpaC
MKHLCRRLRPLLLVVSVAGGPTLAQPLRTPAQPAAPNPAPAVDAATRSQPISVDAGTGILLPLPHPATTIMSAEPSIARVQPASPTSLFLMGVAPGRTTVIATSDTGAPIVQYDVTVVGAARGAPAGGPNPLLEPGLQAEQATAISQATVAAIETSIHRMVLGGSTVHAAAAGGRLILTGSVPSAAAGQQAEAIARGFTGERTIVIGDFMVLSSIQVNVRVRIAEIDRTIARQLGFNWQALGNGGFRFGLLTNAAAGGTNTLLSVPTAGFPASAFNPLQPLGLTTVPDQIGAGFTSGRWDVNGIIDALATDQLVTILAEPNLTAQSGEPASFLAGGEFPIPVAGTTSNGGTSISIVFKQYGVSLEVVPTVLSPTRLNLRVRPEVSQLSTTGAVSVPIAGGTLTIPALVVRRAETTVELGSGQSFAIAGLLQKTTTDTSNTVPGIGELPVIGALFRSTNFQRGESELVIIVTPYLVKPAVTPAALQLPTDGYRPATDLDRILLGRQLARPGGAPLDAGFILK